MYLERLCIIVRRYHGDPQVVAAPGKPLCTALRAGHVSNNSYEKKEPQKNYDIQNYLKIAKTGDFVICSGAGQVKFLHKLGRAL